MLRKTTICVILMLIAIGYGQVVFSEARAVPKMLNYQGYLTDTLGSPIDDSLDMTFKIFDAATMGNELWSESQLNVPVERGVFSVILGSGTPIPDTVFTTGTDRWLELILEGPQTLSPRTRITAMGYAYTSTYSDTAEYAKNAATDNDWVRGTPDSVLFTANYLGIARGGTGNMLYGDSVHTHINLGVACTTGTSGQNRYYCTMAGGRRNVASGHYATVGGGWYNTASGDWATVAGGYNNTADTLYATVGGGRNNSARAEYATVGGGRNNAASGVRTTIGGGMSNTASDWYATVAGGYDNSATDDYATVGGGGYNTAGFIATVGGGYENDASGSIATVGGGNWNTASGYRATVGGGQSNNASDTNTTVAGGYDNTASGIYATVGGGGYNTADSICATVGGGYDNTASGGYATVAGGYSDTASGIYATVGGGMYNSAPAEYATVGGGVQNTASGGYATVAGGRLCNSDGYYSFTACFGSNVPSAYVNSAAFNGQIATAGAQTRVGMISKASGSFTIDHPTEPMDKILNHYFVESPEMVLIYRGVAIIGSDGRAEVHLPDYFDALNRNPMIQLTGVGTPDVVYVSEKVTGNRFVIGGKPGTEVYWTVTGERKDQSAEITRILMPVEQVKEGDLAGHSLDDDFLAATMSQLKRMGQADKFKFRTAEGREKYERSLRALEKTGPTERK